jgi:shikimate dehydrogenase
MSPGARRCAVLGSPIAHSLSPALHTAAYAHLGLSDWSYEAHDVTEPELAGFVSGCDESWAGLSLTMPLKVAALQLGEVDPLAELVGAANTLIFTPAGRQLHNTDVGGLVSAVRRATDRPCRRVTILGAGATARSSLVSAARLGATSVTVVARDPGKGERLRPLAESCGVELDVSGWDAQVPPNDLLISTVTAGAADERAAALVASASVVFDAVYDPWPTRLAVEAARAGRTVVNGLDLLVGQAVLQIRLMTGRDIDPEALSRAGLAALAARTSDEQGSGSAVRQ